MNLNPTWTVLSSMRRHGVRCLLMGGQACVFYGAAEYSRDVDFVLLADDGNLARLRRALHELEAEVIAVPPFEAAHLERGLAVHFRCQAPGVLGLRVDVMSRMRGVDDFESLWERRTTIEVDGLEIDLLSLPDLVKAKKTQRAKDWPMIQRLIEANWFQNRHEPTPVRIDFWLQECRTPELLLELAARFPEEAAGAGRVRPAVRDALDADAVSVARSLEEERQAEAALDQAWWGPLRKELETLRRGARGKD